MKSMEIEKAPELGLCIGIRRAIQRLTEAAADYGEIETLGPVAHNEQLVETLTRAGVRPVARLDQLRGKVVAITTHGTSPDTLADIEASGIEVIDTTCPIVRKVRSTARQLADDGYHVVIFGEAEHSEVRGLLGWTEGKGLATLEPESVRLSGEQPYRVGVISQTTQTQAAFFEFATLLVERLGPETKEIRVVNTLCQAVQRRQNAALRLARRSQLMIVIGGAASANTKRLAEICSPVVETRLVETADQIQPGWLAGKQHVAVTAGTSTPTETIDQVVLRLGSMEPVNQGGR